MGKLKQILTDWRVILLILFLLMSVWTIQPRLSSSGVLIQNVAKNSTAEINGVEVGSIITEVNGQSVAGLGAFEDILAGLTDGNVATITTNEGSFKVVSENGSIGITPRVVPTSNLRKGLDLIGGARVVLKPEGEITQEQLDDATDIIAKRLNVYGLSEDRKSVV